MKILVLVCVTTLAVGLTAPAAQAQARTQVPLSVQLQYRKDTGRVEVRGSALPGTVVSVRESTAVVSDAGTFRLTTHLPISVVAVRGSTIRRLRIELPARAERWIADLTILADLTSMKAVVAGQLTMTNHPPAMVIVHHVEAGVTREAALIGGLFRLELPLIPQTNTLEWAVRVGVFVVPAPSVKFMVQ